MQPIKSRMTKAFNHGSYVETCDNSGAKLLRIISVMGAKTGAGSADCSVCGGRGEIRETSRTIFGNMARISECKNCRGTGKIPKDICANCKGEGRTKKNKTLDIAIPGGIRDGEELVVRGQGGAGFRNGPAGDLYIRINVETDGRFRRVNDDLYYNLNIKVTDALLGKNISVPTLDGEHIVEISPGMHDGEEIRLKGLGVRGSRKGDQIVKIRIDIPRKLSGKARELAEKLASEI